MFREDYVETTTMVEGYIEATIMVVWRKDEAMRRSCLRQVYKRRPNREAEAKAVEASQILETVPDPNSCRGAPRRGPQVGFSMTSSRNHFSQASLRQRRVLPMRRLQAF